ncbi:MAG: hypothetical protein J3R72DRAFT_491416 [Linnemannia gamsii]|nr:MAG: hypothetical protein J3R72DRAFT_491416 [Linnemannia gamsii]
MNQRQRQRQRPQDMCSIPELIEGRPHILEGCYQERLDLDKEEGGSESDSGSTSIGTITNTTIITNSSDNNTTNSCDNNTQCQYLWLLIRQNLGLQTLQLTWSLAALASLNPVVFVYDTLALLPDLTWFKNSYMSRNIAMLLESVPDCRTSPTLGKEFTPTSRGPLTNSSACEVSGSLPVEILSQSFKYLPNLEMPYFSYLGEVAFKHGDTAMREPIFGNTPPRLQELDFTS